MSEQPENPLTASLLREWRMLENPDGTAAILPLPEIMDLKAAVPLASELLALRGSAVTLDASKVQRIGGLCLQVLLSARATWAGDHVALSIANPSAAFAEDAALLGAPSLLPLQA